MFWQRVILIDLFFIIKHGFQKWQSMTWQADNHPSLFAEVRFQDPLQKKKKRKSANNWQALKSIFGIVSVFIFLSKTLWRELLLSFLLPFEHLLIWLEDACELSNKYDAPLHWRVSVMYFYSWGNTAKNEEWVAYIHLHYSYLHPWLSDSVMHHNFVIHWNTDKILSLRKWTSTVNIS